MADALTKLGAGVTNDFTVIDDDILSIDNIGRHLLGIEYIGQSKTKAFESYAKKQTFNQLKALKQNTIILLIILINIL
ncbi:Uncharacterised protein [Actinobacillus equuli]|nr:Uncharacterised protein [Actinobacillus equuli]